MRPIDDSILTPDERRSEVAAILAAGVLRFSAKTLPAADAGGRSEIYYRFVDSAVREPVVADPQIPIGLNDSERALDQRLLGESRGRLEQEFLPGELIQLAILNWVGNRTQVLI